MFFVLKADVDPGSSKTENLSDVEKTPPILASTRERERDVCVCQCRLKRM